MAFQVPRLPKTAQVEPFYVDANADMEPVVVGKVQTILRPGKWGVKVSIPELNPVDARRFCAAQVAHKTEGGPISLSWPQADLAEIPPTVAVDGAGQTGARLAVKGLTPGSTVPGFAFFSFTVSGESFLYCTSGEALVDANGRALLPISPMIRVRPADGAALNFADPQIQGKLETGNVEWSLVRLKHTGVSFMITEIQ
ncbi:hypothetical protein [Caulobacter endophyticus]|uniref:Uncharacterized protein n=1 Tax=Caulobacter endophyticus TaxID=2172652 RepID=A0A2T9K3V4_9CAUL|nr:hypothetical protein [Caulobacter endophyticus]PVM90659.1 hypothetical protein DDF67_09515 [Caulobacter endophyticus]